MRSGSLTVWLSSALLLGIAAQACSSPQGAARGPQPTMATAPIPSAAPPPSGVKGQVWIGPTCPVVQVGSECPDAPYATELLVTDQEDQIVAIVESNEEGFFRIPLPPGKYILVPSRPSPHAPPFADPIPFEVKTGTFTQLEVNYDSGIR